MAVWKEDRIEWLINLEKEGNKLEKYTKQCSEMRSDICCCPFRVNLFGTKREAEDNYIYYDDTFYK